MILTVSERLVLIDILEGEKADFVAWGFINKAIEALSLTSAENLLYQPLVENGLAKWRDKDDSGNPIPQEANIELNEFAIGFLKDRLRRLDEYSQLERKHITLYQKFIVEKAKGEG